MNTYVLKHTFDYYDEMDPEVIEMSFQEEQMDEVLERMTRFLKAVGFVVDGKKLVMVEDEEITEIRTDKQHQLKLPFGWPEICENKQNSQP